MEGNTVYYRFLAGDATAFEEIVRQYRIPLTLFICSTIRDETTAEDIATEVFAHLFLKKQAFAFRSSLKTYLFSIAKNKAKKWLRANRQKEPYNEMEPNSSMKFYVSTEFHSPVEESFFQSEKKKTLYRCLIRIREITGRFCICYIGKNSAMKKPQKFCEKAGNKSQIWPSGGNRH